MQKALTRKPTLGPALNPKFKPPLTLGTFFGLAMAGAIVGPASAQSGKIEEILVTANKRAENIQKVPLAVSAITASDAAKTGVVNAQTLANVVPGLNLNRQTSGLTPFLRGVGSSASTQPGGESPVAVYVDNVYIGSAAGAVTNYSSIDRIEVLKGPQGTLFGRNATGGVVQIFTKDPTPERALDLTVGYANYNTVSGSLYATGALSRVLTANIAVYGERQYDGWGKNYTTGNPAYTQYNFGARIKTLWTPSDRTSVLLNVDFDNFRNAQATVFRNAPGTKNAGTGQVPPPFVYDSFENLDSYVRVAQYGASVKINHDFDWMKLVSISAYRHIVGAELFAQDANPTPRQDAFLRFPTQTFTQELQFQSSDEASLKWIVGAFYLNDQASVHPLRFFGSLFSGNVLNGDGFQEGYSKQKSESYSGFGQATATVASNTHLTLGLRYTVDDRSLSAFGRTRPNGGPTGAFINSPNPQSRKWSALTSRIAIDHQFTDDLMVYAAYNRGFKSGAFNLVVFPPASAIATPVDPEKLDAYTFGVKSEFFDNRLRVNAEAFYYKYRNLQLQQVVPAGLGSVSVLTNAAQASMKGIDVDITAVPTDRLQITASMSVIDGQYDDYPNGQYFVYNPVAGGNCAFTIIAGGPAPCNATALGALPPNYNPVTGRWNLKGNKTVQTPPFSITLTGTYTLPTEIGPFDFTLSWFHSGNYFADADNGGGQVPPSSTNNNRQGIVDILNGSIFWTSTSGRWDVRAWAKNITNQYYWSFANETAGQTKNTPAPPRTFGVNVTTHL